MLEENGVLRTWVVDDIEALRAGKPMPVDEIQSHRLEYLEIEGPLSGNRGSVMRIDRGTLDQLEITDVHVAARLSGDMLQGKLELTRVSPTARRWQLSFVASDHVTR
jgi:hypothetical protein